VKAVLVLKIRWNCWYLHLPHAYAAAGETVELDFKEAFEDDDFFNANPKEVPAHACCYCGLHKPEYVVKCNICSKWFCNSRSGTKGSHIVTHLVRSKHKEATLHPDRSPFPTLPSSSANSPTALSVKQRWSATTAAAATCSSSVSSQPRATASSSSCAASRACT
jgi:hypothetical protein